MMSGEMMTIIPEDNTRVFTKKPMNFSRAHWYATVPLRLWWPAIQDRKAWCSENFGSMPQNPNAWSRWWYQASTIYFRDEADYMLFLLRWEGND